ncbi:MAG: transferrin receptor-like dimerization domain-containing protein [Gemmatimonadaceae bacterium]
MPLPFSSYRARPLAAALLVVTIAAAQSVAQQIGASTGQPRPILGFSPDAVAEQLRREGIARAVPSTDTLRSTLKVLSKRPHEAGTERSRAVAEQILARFKAYGLDAHIERYEALMPRPLSRALHLIAPEQYEARLAESPVAEDPGSRDADQLPVFNAYSPDGNVVAPLVFVNYGMPDDYRVLDSMHVSVRGAIVIAKYGKSWRGIKPKLAAEHGAVGCIIYSDPKDDGFYVDDVYPRGPMRPEQGAQRGSVMDMPLYPGDPLSPGWASEVGSRRLSIKEARTIEPIPVLPIGYGDALPFLRALGGPVAPDAWKGALPITYHVGPGRSRVHLGLTFDWKTRPLYDVIASIPGRTQPDQWIMHGNHHDAWVNGAQDPLSGMVAELETARALGTLLKTGWRPARTIVLAAWDGEEWGLLGSTEYAEKHETELRDKGVVYINSDVTDKGWLAGEGSHSLERFVTEVARDVIDPATGKSALEALLAHKRETAKTPLTVADTTFTLAALGSGSDYTAFLDHVGLASLNVAFGGGSKAGIYHSIYDSYDFFSRFLDTTFTYEVAESQTITTALLRLADAPVLPFDFLAAAHTYRGYVDEIEKEARQNDTTRALDLSAVRTALDKLDRAARRFDEAQRAAATPSAATDGTRAARFAAANRLIYQSERALVDGVGLPGRDWFRHLLYAPGFYTGYGVKTMPGIREAVEDRPHLATAQREAGRVAGAIDRYAARISEAADALAAAAATTSAPSR